MYVIYFGTPNHSSLLYLSEFNPPNKARPSVNTRLNISILVTDQNDIVVRLRIADQKIAPSVARHLRVTPPKAALRYIWSALRNGA